MFFEMRALKEYALLNENRKEIIDNIKENGTVYGIIQLLTDYMKRV